MPTLERSVQETDAPQAATAEDGFAVVMARLCELPSLEEDEDYTQPTEYSYKLACVLLNEANTAFHSAFPHLAFPRASFGTSEAGAVRAYWRKPGLLVQLILPAQKEGDGYIQVLRGQTPEAIHDLTGKQLAAALNEFNERY